MLLSSLICDGAGLSLQQALENSGLNVVQSQSNATSRESQNQNLEVAAAERKKETVPDKSLREKKRSIFKKPIQMPGMGAWAKIYYLDIDWEITPTLKLETDNIENT